MKKYLSMPVFRSSFWERLSQKAGLLAGLFILFFLLSGILTLHIYGLTWDEGLGNLFFGERYFRFFTSFSQKYLDFQANLEELKTLPLNLYLSPFRDRPNEFPPLADTLSAASMYLFAYWLKWLNPIDAFHLFTVLLATIFLGVFYRFTESNLGKFPALMTIFFLGTFPRFWADMHFNVKDVPETILFGMVIISFWFWHQRPSWKASLRTGILMGCALAVKANAIFIPVILFISLLPWTLRIQSLKDCFWYFKKHILHFAFMGTSSVAVYILSWPYLYSDPIHRVKGYWAYIFSQGDRIGGQSWNPDPIIQALATMPEWLLLAFGVGFFPFIRQAMIDKSPFWRLLLLWVTIPILRTSIPGAVNFDGIRHFMEFVPAACLIAGLGVSKMSSWLAEKLLIPKIFVQLTLLIPFILNLVQINRTFFPFLHLYYNMFTGGFAGARDKFLGKEATDYWASSYRQGLEWINQNAPANSYVSALIAPWIVEISAPVLLRQDIQPITQIPDFNVMRQSQDPYYLMFILRDGGSNQDEIDYTRKRGVLVHQITVDRVPILEIYTFGSP